MTPLDPTIQAEQLDGPPISQRQLSKEAQERVLKHLTIATARNEQKTNTKSPRKLPRFETPFSPTKVSQSPRVRPIEIIEISSDESDVERYTRNRKLPLRRPSSALVTPSPSKSKKFRIKSESISPQKSICIDLTGDISENGFSPSTSVSSHTTCVSGMKRGICTDNDLYEDNWWPHSADIIKLPN
ncbi:hypothetical protein FQN49_006623 [Arthroderma sp. PD_2]|nr:hypothetical protein FQN49_006623 [Arthroderma sp. PD_2]